MLHYCISLKKLTMHRVETMKKTNKQSVKSLLISLIFGIISSMAIGETVGVFYNPATPQHTFAAGDVKTALEAKGFTVEINDLSTLSGSYTGKKVVIALASNTQVTALLAAQGGSAAGSPGEQAYALRTTTTPQLSYWVLGGDNNGAMYGGLQIAENIKFHSLAGTYNKEESPTVLKRGIKLNLPWDKNSGTYGKTNGATFEGTSSQLAIEDVWDMTFWTTWFDEMARNRYNVISLWSCHPFTSLVSVPGYEDCAIQNVTYYDGTVKIMPIEQKIVFWQQVMAYAHARGFEFYLFNWNIFTNGATGKYGITSSATNPSTITYMYKSMVELLETYPDLDGFGITNGEKGSTEDFLWNTYGKGMRDYAIANPQRKLRLIHRFHWTTFAEITSLFSSLIALPNVKLDVSFKWSQAHMYSSPVPNNFSSSDKDAILANNLKTWLTVRNDDMYYLTWGNPDFAREYINGMVALGTIYEGFYMGCDGYNPTRTFFSKNSVTQGMLEVQRQEYMMKLWGRLSYNPNTPDEEFKNYLAVKYPTVSSTDLFNAWRHCSKGIQLTTELIQGTYSLDFHWYPEDCGSGSGFRTIANFGGANVASGSKLCSINKSASGTCGSSMSSYQLADYIETSSNEALSLISAMSADNNTELGVTLNNIKALSYLGLYCAEKIRGATYLKANNTPSAITAMGKAYSNWMLYVNIMDAMFTGMDNQRVDNLANWHAFDANVLKEFHDLGGVGTPGMETNPPTPNPAQFAVPPAALSRTSISMTAVIGTDAESIPVEYRFTEAGGKSSGWQSSPVYIDTNLLSGTQYTYTVTMRDSVHNQTTTSAPLSAFTWGEPDIVKNYSIDLNDFVALAMQWLESDCYLSTLCAGTDLNADGAVDLEDFRMLAVSWQMQLTPPVPGFKESGGLVCMEAEHYNVIEQRAEPEMWKQSAQTPGYVGEGYMWTDGNYTVTAPVYTEGTRMLYPIVFSSTGTFNVYVRRYSDTGTYSNSAWAGLDNVGTGVYDNTADLGQWIWKSLGTVTVSTLGVKTLDIVRREEGYKIDRIVLTQGAIPTGTGPAESPR
jgi:hypothetical protein